MRDWIGFVIARRKWVVGACLLFTAFLLSRFGSLRIVINSDNFLPQSNRFTIAEKEIERTFGNKYTVVIGVTAKDGTIYQTPILEKVRRITRKLRDTPDVIKTNINSLAARKAKGIEGNAEGMIVRPLMERVPRDGKEMAALEKSVASIPAYEDLLVSKDRKTTLIVAEYKDSPQGFLPVGESIRAIVDPERDASVDIAVGGLPIFLAWLERYSARMAFLLPLAVLIVGLIHYEAFRTVQAAALPLVTAVLSVVWALGLLAVSGTPMDVFNASTPILILAVAAGHAVQILKRYYEEFSRLREAAPGRDPHELSREAVLGAMSRVGPVMLVACLVASLGFFSLVVFEIKAVRTFGVLTGAGILSALILELTFIPALRSMLPPPGDKEFRREKERSVWDRWIEIVFEWVSHKRAAVYVLVALVVVALSLGGRWLRVSNSQRQYFDAGLELRRDDSALNSRSAGASTLYVLVDAGADDGIKDPAALAAIEKIQERLQSDPRVGKTLSIVDFIKRMNQAMNGDRRDAYRIPTSRELVAQYLLLYSNSGEPQDFDSYVDYGYRKADIQVFLKTDESGALADIIQKTQAYADEVLPSGARARIGGGVVGSLALNEEMIREKILNILQILACVFVICSLIFRSLQAGLLILVPLVATVFVNFGVMGLIGIPLNISTALVSAMAVGIGADYAIYLSFRMREELRAHPVESEALRTAFLSAGKATLFVSSAVAGGFGVLMLSRGFNMHVWMGFLVSLAMVVSSFSTLTVFAALLLSLRPRFVFAREEAPRAVLPGKGALVGAAAGLLLLASAAGAAPTADEIMTRSFLTSKVADSTTDATFRLVNASGQERVRRTTGPSKLTPGTTDNRRLITFESPADVRGTKTLLVEHSAKDDDIWIYLPAMKKVRRLVASNKKDSFVGTDFSYGDVIGHKVEDWTHRLLREEKAGGKDCWVVESLPKRPEVAENTGYSKRVSWIDRESAVEVRAEVYDLGGELLKKTASEDVRKVDAKNGKWQAMRLIAENVQTGHKTIIDFENFKANVGVADDVFTPRALEK